MRLAVVPFFQAALKNCVCESFIRGLAPYGQGLVDWRTREREPWFAARLHLGRAEEQFPKCLKSRNGAGYAPSHKKTFCVNHGHNSVSGNDIGVTMGSFI